jgi:hypothetical protein
MWYVFYGQQECKVLKFKHVYVLGMGTMLFLKEVYTSAEKCSRPDKCD